MSLRFRFLLLLLIFMLVVIGMAVGFSYCVVLDSATRTDQAIASQRLSNATKILRIGAEQLFRVTTDWAVWDDTYAFMSGKDPEYPARNLVEGTFSTLELDLVAFWDAHQEPALERFVTPSHEIKEQLPGGLRLFLNNLQLAGRVGPTNGLAGYASLDGTVWVLAAMPILTSKGEGPPQGTLFMGRRLDEERLQILRDQIDFSFQMETAHSRWPLGRSFVQAISPSVLRAAIAIEDVTKQGRLALILTLPRTAYLQARRGLFFLLAWLAILSILLLVVTVAFLDRWILKDLVTSVVWLREAMGEMTGRKEGTHMPRGRLPNEIRALQAEVRNVVETIRQTTAEMARRREEAIQAQRLAALGTLTAGLAHEINNPNTILRLNLSVIQQTLETLWESNSDVGKRELLEDALAAARESVEASARIESIVRRARSLAMRVPKDPTGAKSSVADILQESLQWVQQEVSKKKCHVEVELEPNLPMVLMDPEALREVLNNLILNACQAVREGEGTILVRGRYDAVSERIVLEVSDNGCGMPPDVLERALDPFFTTRRGEGGTGLGLPISVLLVRQWGGTLSLSSTEGRGTVVRIVLPWSGTHKDSLS